MTRPPSGSGLSTVAAPVVRRALRERTEIGLLDVRPEGRFAEGHPLFAASFPLGRLEFQVFDRLPRKSVPLVIYGDDQRDTAMAASRLRELGYLDVAVLAGGLDGWVAGGGELFQDVNSPSKAFGELVQVTSGTPAIEAAELRDLLGARADVIVVDARTVEEYRVMSIPTATSVPGAELALRVRVLAADPATTVVVNCAGRTRSIIGAQSLINAGLPNKVVALRNGTIGWTLAGLPLDHGSDRRAPEVPAATAYEARAAAHGVARRAGVRHMTRPELHSALSEQRRTVYRFDVRTDREYEAGHFAGFRSAPGGQLVQETDWFAPVRGALMVLADDPEGRAAMTASWLAQMGWDTALLQAEARDSGVETGLPAARLPEPPDVPLADPAQVDSWIRTGEAAVIDVDTSKLFRAGHVPGAAWLLRADLADPELHARLGCPARLVLTSADGYLAAFAHTDLRWQAGTEVAVLAGGTAGWAASGRPLSTAEEPMLSAPVDIYRRPYEGTDVDHATMQAYLDWEYGLVAQLKRDGTHGFAVLR